MTENEERHESSRQSRKSNPNLIWSKSADFRGISAKAQLKWLNWPRLPVWQMRIVSDVGLPFWSTNIMRPARNNCNTATYSYLPEEMLRSAHSSQGNSRWDFLKYIHKNLFSSSKYKTQCVHNYTSLSCPTGPETLSMQVLITMI